MPRTKQFDEQQVLEKAMLLFWEKGFNATSIQDLVDNMGINRASLYSTYGDKQALFDKAFQHYCESSFEQLRDVFESATDAKTGFRGMFQMILKGLQKDCYGKGCFAVNTSTELMPKRMEYATVLSEKRETLIEIFRQSIQRDIDAGKIDPSVDAEKTAAFFHTFYNGLQVVSKYNTNREELKQLLDTALQLLKSVD